MPFSPKCRLPSAVEFIFIFVLASFAISIQTGCSSIGVKRVDRQEWILENTDTALTTGNISRRVRDYMALHGIDGAFDDEPGAVLVKLAKIFRKTEDNETLDALIELCFYHAENSSGEERTSAHLSAAYYAYISLFQGLPGLPPDSPYEPRYLFNCRFYDHSVAGFLLDLQNSGISFDKPFELPLVDGRIVKFSQAISTLPLPLSDYETFLNCFGYMPEGLNTYSRRAGLGAPLIPVRKQFPADDLKEEGSSLGGMFPATLFIRFAQPFSMEGSPEAVMEFHDTTKDEFVDVGDKKVPLELDISTPFAYFLRNRPVIVRGIYYLLNPGEELAGIVHAHPI